MHIHLSTTILFVTLQVVAVKALVPITVYNQCSKSIELYDNNVVETVVSGGTAIRTLSLGFRGTLRDGVNSPATLAEFSMVDGCLMYGLNIIPSGVNDPTSCTSLEECKAITGSTGYNTPMQISPAGCTAVTCLEDGCVDAYHFPTDDTKAHKCTNPTSILVTFCPGGSEGLSQQQQPSAILPTFAAPTPAPTQSPSFSSTMEALPPTMDAYAPTMDAYDPTMEAYAPTMEAYAPTMEAYAPTMEALPPIPTIEVLPQLQTEASTLTQTEASLPAIDAVKSDTATLTETPIITPLKLAGSKVKSCDGDYENATPLPKMESKTDTSVYTTATDDTAAGTATVAPTVDAPAPATQTPTITPVTLASSKVKSCDGDYENATPLPKMESKTDTSVYTTATDDTATGTATVAPTVDASAPATQVVSPLSSKPQEESTQSVNTQRSADDGTGASTYVGTGLGLMAVVAIVAVVVAAQKKKKKEEEEVGETEEKEFNQEDVMTPLTQINVL
ncbi:hypothetical protein DD237_001315 [Peronospora effusa]|uniref:Thaumatin-like protein n=1 Tax=Peronospora effusa TaxID=542832 RepID=A0A3R8D0Q1_9STRA|nr:hypothetical protein DD237_001315 [Peronospora effusa]